MRIELISIANLKLNPENPRLIKDDRYKSLVKSIKEFPKMLEIRPIVVNDQLTVLGGNMRLKACKDAGIKKVPVIKASTLSKDEQREFIIKDNLGYGDWDWTMLSTWDQDELENWGLEISPLNKFKDVHEDTYEIPDEIKTKIVPGDYIEIGRHRLVCGDSTSRDTFKSLFRSGKADLVVTDPPYNVGYEGGTKKKLKIMNDRQDDSQFYKFLHSFFVGLNDFVKPGAAWYVWHADTEGANFRLAMKNAGIDCKQCLVWVKNSMVLGRQDYQWKHEPCLYGWKSGTSHSWYSDRKQTTVLEFDRPQRNEDHPTMKPVLLIAYQVGNSSKAGDIVVDPFGGSGTTMVSSHQLDRIAYMVEFDPKYCQVIVDRMKTLEPGLPIKRNGKRYGI